MNPKQKRTVVCCCLFGALTLFTSIASTFGQEQAETAKSSSMVELSEEAKVAEQEMRNKFEDGSEAMLMLDAIVAGRRMGPDDGWFEVAKPQSIYSWEQALQWYDADNDQKISQKEFKGSVEDFAAIDRNQDRFWTESDWTWADTRGSDTFRKLADKIDEDQSGDITVAELKQFVAAMTEDQASLSLEQLRSQLDPPARERRSSDGPTPSHLIMGLSKQEIGSHSPGPDVGDIAPDFEMKDLEGQLHSLSKTVHDKPTVLIFGNFTCGPFRSQSANVRNLIHRYQDRVNFLMVYVREAHPSDGWNMKRNEAKGIEIPQPQTFEDRFEVASQCSLHFEAGVPMLVDDLNDTVGAKYSGMPSRLYLIDTDQKVLFKSGRGPHYFLPSDLENTLVLFLNRPDQVQSVGSK